MNTNHTLTSYDRQLEHLTGSILEMGVLVREMILIARQALVERDPALVDLAIARDKEINRFDHKIEQQATVVLALQNPMAVDLRYVTSALKIAVSLERMGDLAKNTAKRSVRLGDYRPQGITERIGAMVDIVVSMLDDALAAVKARSVEQATEVWQRDDEVDAMYHDILTSMQEAMVNDPPHILSGTHLVFAAKNFERLADYATKIAKTVHYVISGQPANKQALLNNQAAAN